MDEPQVKVRPGSCGSFGGRKKNGDLCGKPAIGGTKRCDIHAGKKTSVAKAQGHLRLAAESWSLDDLPASIDATAEAIRLILVTKRFHADLYGALQADVMSKDMAALVGVAYGESGKTGEYITGLAELEGRERERLWRFLKDYRQAGYEESRLELAERQIDMLQAVLVGVLSDLGLDPADRIVQGVVLKRIQALEA
jgi:hypothetical protein